MKKIIQKILSLGADFSTKKALRTTVRVLGMKPENIDKLYVELKNDLHREEFKAISPKKKAVFIPQCLRKSAVCRARMSEEGWLCAGCSKDCQARMIMSEAKEKGYSVFIVAGSSMVYNLIKKHRPHAVLGIGCLPEISMAMEEVRLPGQVVELSKAGCVDTRVDMAEVSDVINHKKSRLYT